MLVSSTLLIIIYISFVSLGLPDSILGSAWPVMYQDLGSKLSLGGTISTTICFGTVISSLLYSRINGRIRVEILNLLSTLLTAISLLCFSFSKSMLAIYPSALLLGLGAGAIDASLNNYVALNYKARHMSYLHAAWGVGTTIAPIIISYLFTRGLSWRNGYRIIAALQLAIFFLLLLNIGLWRRMPQARKEEKETASKNKKRSLKGQDGVKTTFLSFFLYCGLESTIILWVSSFMINNKGFSAAEGAIMVSMFFYGITSGRIISGLVSEKLGDNKLILSGHMISLASASMFFLLPERNIALYAAVFLIGVGNGPVYPSMLHQTPEIFPPELSGSVMGLEMASAYIGSTTCPLVFGLFSSRLGFSVFPLFALLFLFLELYCYRKKRLLV